MLQTACNIVLEENMSVGSVTYSVKSNTSTREAAYSVSLTGEVCGIIFGRVKQYEAYSCKIDESVSESVYNSCFNFGLLICSFPLFISMALFSIKVYLGYHKD